MKDIFIPGIYNYCDRWCERCTFTSRCRNYESTSKLSTEQLDISNKAFWDTISSNFEKTMELLHKAAAEHGFDISQPMSPEEEREYEQKQSIIKSGAKQHELSKLCKKYQRIAKPFADKSDDFVAKTRELVDHLHLGIRSAEEVVYTVAGIGDCFDIIQWYLFFIDAKLQRALHGKLEGEEWEVENGFPKDSDGSARIAIIAVERSIEAWARLYNLLPESEDIALQSLAVLEQLKRKALEEFPEATQFKRPGFDD